MLPSDAVKMPITTRQELDLFVQTLLKGEVRVFRFQLLTKDANVRLPQRKNHPAGETPLMLASGRGHLPAVRLLISPGGIARRSALAWACRLRQNADRTRMGCSFEGLSKAYAACACSKSQTQVCDSKFDGGR